MHYIYKLTNKTNNKVYIGQTKDIRKRKYQHRKCSTNKHLRNAIAKDGWDNFAFEIIDFGLNQWHADCLEINTIALHDSRNSEKGYNVSPGGYWLELSDEMKEKMIAANVGRIPWNKDKAGTYHHSQKRIGVVRGPMSEETKRKIGDAQLGNKNHTYGKTHSEEHKRKIGEKSKGNQHRLGKPNSLEVRQKCSLALKGKPWSEARKKAQDNSRGNKGKTWKLIDNKHVYSEKEL